MPPKKCEGEPCAKKRNNKASDIQLTFNIDGHRIITAKADPTDPHENSISIVNTTDGTEQFQVTIETVKDGDKMCSFIERNALRMKALSSSFLWCYVEYV